LLRGSRGFAVLNRRMRLPLRSGRAGADCRAGIEGLSPCRSFSITLPRPFARRCESMPRPSARLTPLISRATRQRWRSRGRTFFWRCGGAVDLLHHLADFVFKEPSPALPAYADVGAVRTALKPHCTYLRTTQSFDDVVLLNDIARAFKHHRPDHGTPTVAVSTAIVPVASGWGTMRWDEGKYGGAEQVVVTKTDGDKRAVSSVLQNVFDAWMRLLGQPLLPINQF